MSELRTNTIVVRGASYVVQEMTAATMIASRRVIAEDQARLEAFVTWKCCLDPKFASEAAVLELPQIVADRVSAEAFRLTKEDEPGNG